MTPTFDLDLDPPRARRELVRLLQKAHAGELAASLAYRGHALSLRGTPEAEIVRKIERDELDHRARVACMLAGLDAGPDPRRERAFAWIGRTIGWLCRIGGWYAPMYGAGRLELGNIGEYEDAARLAVVADQDGLADSLLGMAEVEWEHERFFRSAVSEHWLRRVIRPWRAPPPKERIRRSFEDFRSMRRHLRRRSESQRRAGRQAVICEHSRPSTVDYRREAQGV